MFGPFPLSALVEKKKNVCEIEKILVTFYFLKSWNTYHYLMKMCTIILLVVLDPSQRGSRRA